MKKLLLLLIFTTSVYGQGKYFIIQDNKNVTWQKIFTDTISKNSLIKSLRLSGKFSKAEINQGNIDFEFKYIANDFTPYGYQWNKDAIFLKNGGICKGFIEFKDNAYRVTIFKIDIIDPLENFRTDPVYIYFFKANGQLKTNDRFERIYSYYDSYFNDLFIPKQVKSDW